MEKLSLNVMIEGVTQLEHQEQILLLEYLKQLVANQAELDQIIQEFEDLKANGVQPAQQSLYGMFREPVVDVSFEELQETLHEIATEWEKEWDEPNPS